MRIRFLAAAILAASFLLQGCVSHAYVRVRPEDHWRAPHRRDRDDYHDHYRNYDH